MKASLSRRRMLQAVGAAAVPTLTPRSAAGLGMRGEGRDTPKLCMNISDSGLNDAGMRRIKQLGVDYVLMTGPPIPWEESVIRFRMDRLKAGGLNLANMMIAGFPRAIYGSKGRDEDIGKVRQSIRAAGRAGLPVIEYNFYAHRIVEGHFEETGRAGSGVLAFHYDRVKDLPPLPEEGAHTLDEMWANVTYFLKAVVPVAQEAGVRLALHPNDPPPPISCGSGQIMGSVEGWKRSVPLESGGGA